MVRPPQLPFCVVALGDQSLDHSGCHSTHFLWVSRFQEKPPTKTGYL